MVFIGLWIVRSNVRLIFTIKYFLCMFTVVEQLSPSAMHYCLFSRDLPTFVNENCGVQTFSTGKILLSADRSSWNPKATYVLNKLVECFRQGSGIASTY